MLAYLRIRGLALLDDVELELGAGLTVLTGETGAGKSILVDALTLLRGARPRGPLVRSGAAAAVVDGVFELEAGVCRRVAGLLGPAIELDGPELVLQRVVPERGRGRASAQAELLPLASLEPLGELLLDVCSQHEHHSLAAPARQLELLDSAAGLGAEGDAYEAAFAALRAAEATLEAERARAAEATQRLDFAEYQLAELERVAPVRGEAAALSARLVLLRDSRRYAELAGLASEVLEDADESVRSRLATVAERARRLAVGSPLVGELVASLEAADAACLEAVRLAERLAQAVELDPAELERAEERAHQLESLRRRHGVEADELVDRIPRLREEVEQLRDTDGRLARAEQVAREARASALALAERLHGARLEAAGALSAAIGAELRELHLPAARVELRVERRADGALGPRGLDRVELLFSANPGEPLAPLSRVASGGELSRVLLAVKSVLSAGDAVATYVFDEVDAGVGGAAAEAIARRLARAAKGRQVLCITHLPQIAAFADRHLRVRKHQEAERTVTRVSTLDEAGSLEELARMLGGAEITDSAREHARALRAAATRWKGASLRAVAAAPAAPPPAPAAVGRPRAAASPAAPRRPAARAPAASPRRARASGA